MKSFSSVLGPATRASKPSEASTLFTVSTSSSACSPTDVSSTPASVTGSSVERPVSETGPSFGSHDDELDVFTGATKPLFQQACGPFGFGIVREVGVGRQGTAEEQR